MSSTFDYLQEKILERCVCSSSHGLTLLPLIDILCILLFVKVRIE